MKLFKITQQIIMHSTNIKKSTIFFPFVVGIFLKNSMIFFQVQVEDIKCIFNAHLIG
jgi:hypothetical protein